MIKSGSIKKYIIYAIGEILLVVIGILIALQINNWNETRKLAKEEQFILKKLKTNISDDIRNIKNEFEMNESYIGMYKHCMDILSGKVDATREEFIESFNPILVIGLFDQNRLTFDNLVSSGKIDIIINTQLLDSLMLYYNYNYKSWDTALRDYTRNITAPYVMGFDHIPKKAEGYTHYDLTQFDVKPRPLSDYKNDVFIINILRQKIFNLEGQTLVYNELLTFMESLLEQIDREIE